MLDLKNRYGAVIALTHMLVPSQQVRDLWRQKDMKVVEGSMSATARPHGVMRYKLTPRS